mgnify:CR=1 FL=1
MFLCLTSGHRGSTTEAVIPDFPPACLYQAPFAGAAGQGFQLWLLYPRRCTLSEAELHLSVPPQDIARGSAECSSASRRDFLTRRLALRRLLAARLAVSDSRSLDIRLSPTGKPQLSMSSGKDPHYDFSLSQSGELCVIALAAAADGTGHPPSPSIGVDVEALATAPDVSMFRRYATEEEQRSALAAGLENDAHTRCLWWTRHEAIAKASGRGLPWGLRRLSVPLDWSEGSAATIEDSRDGRAYTLRSYGSVRGFIISVALGVDSLRADSR